MGHIFLSFLFFNLFILVINNHYKRGDYYIKKRELILYTALLVLFGVYGGGEGDYFKYKENVELYHSIFDIYNGGMEPQYYYLSYLVDGNYNLWRLVLFSVQFVGMSWLIYKANLNSYPLYLSFISLCLVSSVYGRTYWGAIYFFMGVYLLIEKKNPLYLIIIALSYVSHTQNLVLLALLPLAFFDIKKWHMLLVLLFFGTFVSFLDSFFVSILDSGGIEGADYVNDRMVTYSNSELGSFGNSFLEYVMFFLHYLPVAFLIITWVRIIMKRRDVYYSFYKPYRRVLNLTLYIVIISFVVLMASLGGGTFFYRILGMIFFPISILLPYMLKIGVIKKRTFNNYILFFIITTEIGYIKDFYYAYAHGIL